MKKFEMFITTIFVLGFMLVLLKINPVADSALSILMEIQINKIFVIVLGSWMSAIFLSFLIIDLLGKVFNLDSSNLIPIAYFIFSILLGFGLLKTLTEQQFSLISGFIAFPLFLSLPDVFKQIINNRQINDEDDKYKK